ncbi:MAG TPA: hypothetical protein VHZ55_16660 [Bryobacteraceae bacterium]|nr:hypothetical protein [Bryobacteraceae bacterium]
MTASCRAIPRRDFLKVLGAATAFESGSNAIASSDRYIAIVVDADDPVAASVPVKWAAGQLREAIVAKGWNCEVVSSMDQLKDSTFCVVAAASASRLADGFPGASAPLAGTESIRMMPGHMSRNAAVLVSGSDPRGFVYGLLELAERVRFSTDPIAVLHLRGAFEEKSANEVRSVARAFCSEIEDKSWFYDRNSWREYLDMLVASRFNRFNLAFGFGYDFPSHVTGDYFHFVYPYLVDVPGYQVRVIRLVNEPGPLSTEERNKNFETLRFIAAETASRGLEFQLGIWTHAYQWTDSPRADHRIEGLTPELHAAYCRDALAIILKACPEIQGLTLRVHGESGIPEGSYSFWNTLFRAVSTCGRKIEIDMHAKGVDQRMIDLAADTGMPVKLGAKYCAEHQSLGYHQADIRELEIPQPDRMEAGVFNLSNGARRFTRYGYADFYQQASRYKLWFRLWPGTQRHLLSGDPEAAAAFGRTAHFCGAAGIELCEPLTFKGREGSGQAGGRCAYADTSLNPQHEWKKFEHYYRVWGRRLYNPEADPETWRRALRRDYGPGANAVESAVANASRVLPLLTSAHLPSASNHAFWPEMYTNMPIVPGSERVPYSDTPNPKCFGTVSPLDPQLFSSIVEHAADLLAGRVNAKYSPAEVAQWLEDHTAASSQALAAARMHANLKTSAEFRRMEEDVLIQIGLGQFFAAKLRSGLLFEIYQQTGDPRAGQLALAQYRKAYNLWAAMARRAQRVYRSNISYGSIPMRQGHWIDRLPDITRDITAMEMALRANPGVPSQKAQAAIRTAIQRTVRASASCSHTPQTVFAPGKPLPLELVINELEAGALPSLVQLFYRHVNQGERWQFVRMEQVSRSFRSAIPGEYTNSAFPLQYYFELRRGASAAWFYPALNSTLSNQSYFAIYRRGV